MKDKQNENVFIDLQQHSLDTVESVSVSFFLKESGQLVIKVIVAFSTGT